MMTQVKSSIIFLLLMTLLTGIIYPLLITVIAQLCFPWQANGSLIESNKQIVGSLLIGQAFTDDKYFWSRPSATQPFPYNAMHSAGSNWSARNPDYLTTVQNRVTHLLKSNPPDPDAAPQLVPVDLVTASGSGLDPEISPNAAYYQVARIAKAQQLPENEIRQLIAQYEQPRMFGILGKPRVNVLQLNMALIKLEGKLHDKTR